MKGKPKNKRQHYVPRHYLRLFADADDRIGVAALDPYRFIGPDSMKSHCQGSYFYGHHDETDAWLGEVEKATAPMLRKIAATRKIEKDELLGIRLLMLLLFFRTRKAAEIAKLCPTWIADQFVKSQINQGRLSEPSGGWNRTMIDFEGASSMLLRHGLVFPLMEMISLDHVFIVPEEGVTERFVTSDHPVAALNPFLDRRDSVRSFAGFSRAGFQLILPLGPRCCLLFFDPGVYDILEECDGTVPAPSADIDRINALQIQGADRRLIFTPDTPKERVAQLQHRFGDMRKPVADHLREIQADHLSVGTVLMMGSNLQLPEPLDCWKIRDCPHVEGTGYRNLAWTEYCERVADEFERKPGDLGEAMQRAEEARGLIDDPPAPNSRF